MEDKIGANKAGTAGNDNSHFHSSIFIVAILDSPFYLIVPHLALKVAEKSIIWGGTVGTPAFFVPLSTTPFLVYYHLAIQSNQNFFNIISILLAFPHPSCYNIFNNNLILLEMESAIKGSD